MGSEIVYGRDEDISFFPSISIMIVPLFPFGCFFIKKMFFLVDLKASLFNLFVDSIKTRDALIDASSSGPNKFLNHLVAETDAEFRLQLLFQDFKFFNHLQGGLMFQSLPNSFQKSS